MLASAPFVPQRACDDGALGMRACGSLSAVLGCAGARRGAGGGKIGWLCDCAGLPEEMCGMLLGLGFAEGTGAPPSCDAGGLSAARLLKTGGGLGVPGWWEGYRRGSSGTQLSARFARLPRASATAGFLR